jgi:hypothetical protein
LRFIPDNVPTSPIDQPDRRGRSWQASLSAGLMGAIVTSGRRQGGVPPASPQYAAGLRGKVAGVAASGTPPRIKSAWPEGRVAHLPSWRFRATRRRKVLLAGSITQADD